MFTVLLNTYSAICGEYNVNFSIYKVEQTTIIKNYFTRPTDFFDSLKDCISSPYFYIFITPKDERRMRRIQTGAIPQIITLKRSFERNLPPISNSSIKALGLIQ